ncbi:DUF3253 domain-containing protein [Sphingopyxis fribergensis]
MMSEKAHDAALALLAERSAGRSICPGEVARVISVDDNWRSAMPDVHAATGELLKRGVIQISWKGRPHQSRAGPYRITARANAKGSGADQ